MSLLAPSGVVHVHSLTTQRPPHYRWAPRCVGPDPAAGGTVPVSGSSSSECFLSVLYSLYWASGSTCYLARTPHRSQTSSALAVSPVRWRPQGSDSWAWGCLRDPELAGSAGPWSCVARFPEAQGGHWCINKPDLSAERKPPPWCGWWGYCLDWRTSVEDLQASVRSTADLLTDLSFECVVLFHAKSWRWTQACYVTDPRWGVRHWL